MEVTTARILDKRRMLKKSKTYKLAIRVTFNRKPIPFPVDINLSESDFNKLSSPRLGKELSEIRDKFLQEEKRANEIIQRIGTFTFQAFREEFYKHKLAEKIKYGHARKRPVSDVITEQPYGHTIANNEGKNKKYGQRKFDRIRSNVNYAEMGPLAVAFGDYIKLLEVQERIGTSECYFSTLMNLLSFKSNLRFEDISTTFLYEYEKWMLSRGNSLTTIGIYLRNLRSIFNLQLQRTKFLKFTILLEKENIKYLQALTLRKLWNYPI